MKKTILTIGIIFLLIGVSIVSSTDNLVKDSKTNYQPLKSIDISKELLSIGNIAYCCDSLNLNIYWFELDNPGTLNFLAEGQSVYFLTAGTWSCEDKIFACEYNTGGLWTIDPETGDMVQIGGGGTSCNSLSWDPINNRLYSVGSTGLYEYDPETGEQWFIGGIGGGPSGIRGIAFDENGTLYGWDPYNLWIIDIETCEAILVGPLGISGCDGHFDYDTDILYIISGNQLIECDENTGECSLVGDFESGFEITCLAIPYDCSNIPPVTTISFEPPYPNGENGWYVTNVTATLNATDNDGVYRTFYRINGEEWEIYESPFIIPKEDEDILIEYYSLDNMGNFEDKKSATIDIDKTPPNMTVEWEVEKVGWRKWLISFTIICNDNESGMDRVEISFNGDIQSVIPSSGPAYHWSWIIYSPFSFKFIAYDIAGNYAVVVVNDTDISYHNQIRDIFNQQSINPFILRLLERFPLLQKLIQQLSFGL